MITTFPGSYNSQIILDLHILHLCETIGILDNWKFGIKYNNYLGKYRAAKAH